MLERCSRKMIALQHGLTLQLSHMSNWIASMTDAGDMKHTPPPINPLDLFCAGPGVPPWCVVARFYCPHPARTPPHLTPRYLPPSGYARAP